VFIDIVLPVEVFFSRVGVVGGVTDFGLQQGTTELVEVERLSFSGFRRCDDVWLSHDWQTPFLGLGCAVIWRPMAHIFNSVSINRTSICGICLSALVICFEHSQY